MGTSRLHSCSVEGLEALHQFMRLGERETKQANLSGFTIGDVEQQPV
jgi:hypothetical protein